MRDVAAEVARYLAEPGTYSGSAGSDGRLHEPIVRVIGKRLIDAGHRVANELRFAA